MTPEDKYGPMGPGQDPAFTNESNFRDLGGYETADGRTVRHGLIWRSGALAFLSDPEMGHLRELGLRWDLDLRSAAEADELPEPRVPGMAYERICGMLDARGDEVNFSPEGIARILDAHREVLGAQSLAHVDDGSEDTDMFSAKALAAMDELYVGMAFGNPAFRRLFAQLEAGAVPLVFHCTAGKDRTGVAAMLILLALGASEEDALFDYLLTNRYLRDRIRQMVAKDLGVIPDDVPEEYVVRAGVSEQMGRSVLGAIVERYGSYEAYFGVEYGLGATRLRALRERYTC